MYTDGTPNEPKRSHLVTLHQILATYNGVLLSEAIQINSSVPVVDVVALNVAKCDPANPFQNITFVDDTQRICNDWCLLGTCAYFYPATFAPCSGSDAQKLSFDDEVLVNDMCLDVYSSAGPNVGICVCTGEPCTGVYIIWTRRRPQPRLDLQRG